MNHLSHGSWFSNLCDQSRGPVPSATTLGNFPDLAKQQNIVNNHDFQSDKRECKHKAGLFRKTQQASEEGRGQSRWNWRLTSQGKAGQNSAESAVDA